MERRILLQDELESLLVSDVARMDDGSLAIVFQPPETIKLRYPCVIYEIDDRSFRHADDRTYQLRPRYSVTVIDPDPDSQIANKIQMHFSMCRPERRYTADNLYHDSLSLYY